MSLINRERHVPDCSQSGSDDCTAEIFARFKTTNIQEHNLFGMFIAIELVAVPS